MTASDPGTRKSAAPELIEDVYPLSPMQQGMLFHSLYHPGSGMDFLQLIITLREEVSSVSLKQAWFRVVERHAVLRTAFRWDDAEPVQEVYSGILPPWQERDWRDLARPVREEQLEQFLQEDRLRNFDLRRPPLMRLSLFRMEDSEYRLVWSLHHAILDGRSLVLVLREMFACYEALVKGVDLPLEEPRPYRDFITWLRQQDFTQSEAYWRSALAGIEEITSLSAAFSHRQQSEACGHGVEEMRLSEALTASMQSLAERHELTPNTIVQGAWAILLSRYTGKDDVVFGVTRACRRSAMQGAAELVGMVINTLPLRVQLPANARVLPWLRALRALNVAVRPHEHTPLANIQRWSSTAANSLLFDTLLGFENYDLNEAFRDQGGAWEHRYFELRGKTNYPVTVIAYLGTELRIRIIYDRNRLDDDEVARMSSHLRTLLEGIVADPERQVSSLPMLSVVERDQLLVEWNATGADYPRDRCIHELFEEQVERTPEAGAIVFEDQQLTYRQLNARANQLAHYLQTLGVGPDALVGLCLERSVDLIVGLLGILKAGGAYVPLDPTSPLDRLSFVLEDARVPVLLTQNTLLDTLPAHWAQVVCLDSDWEFVASQPTINPASGSHPDTLAYVIYTSGSTGRPKAVGVEHRHLLNYVLGVSQRLGLKTAASYATVSTLAADLGNTMVFPSLCLGGCLHLISSERAMDAARFGEYLCSHRIDYLKIVPSHLWALLGEGAQPAQRLPREALVLGGEASSWELVAKIQEASPGLRVFNHYGPTETTVGVLTYAVELAASAQTTGSLTVPLGRALPNTQVYVLNACREPVPVGVVGELYIGGAGVSRGYLNSAELTQERFVSDAFSGVAGARLYRTGDLVRYLADGNVEFVGRADNQVKIRGFRIELGEIESVLLQHGGVREAVVVAREDVAGEKRLVGYVVGQAGSVSVSALRAHLGEKLPEYMIPSTFVLLEALPLTSNGKVDRKALPAPEPPGQEHSDVAARTPVEEGLAQIWQEVLHLEQVGVHTSFFALGGHSLLATQVISRIRNTFAVELPLQALFEAPTIAGLAARIAASGASDPSEAPGLVRVSREGRLPLSFAQQRLWFIDQMEPGSRLYVNPYGFRLTGRLNFRALQDSLAGICMRHDVLRSTYPAIDGSPVQIVSQDAPAPLSFLDLSDMPEPERKSELEQLISDSCNLHFDLAEGPLFRAQLVQRAPEDYLLLLVIHHIVWDGRSTDVLLQELSALYDAFSSGRPSQLPELAIQYADYAAWQRDWVQGKVTETQLSYWRTQLSEAAFGLPIRTDRAESATPTFEGGLQRFFIGTVIANPLEELAQQERASLFIVLFAAFNVLLYQDSRQQDICIGTPVSGRRWTETEGLIGLFLNTLVIRSDLSGNPSFRGLVGRVRDTVLAAHAHQDLPFEQVVDAVKRQRDLSHTPLFRVWFTFGESSAPVVECNGLSIQSTSIGLPPARYALRMGISHVSDGLQGSLEYQTDLFEAETIQRLTRKMEVLLSVVASDADLPLRQIAERLREVDRQSREEQEQRLDDGNRQRLGRRTRTAIRG